MRFDIEFGKKTMVVEIPDGNLIGVVEPDCAPNPFTAAKILGEMTETNPDTNLETFIEKVRGQDEVFVIINDANRPTPSYIVLEALLPILSTVKNVTVSIATGSHKAPSEDEIVSLLGKSYSELRSCLHIHDAADEEAHIYLGNTSRGTPVHFDSVVCNASNILVIGSVEPHYFAGYTGGRKAFLPGHAVYRTIEDNHSFSLREKASLLNLDGNPVHLDMVEACEYLAHKNIYSIQLVLDCIGNIAGAFGGSLGSSFQAAIPLCRKYFVKEIQEKADIVITVAEYPMDISLYQSQKTMENAKLALKKGGILIFASATRKGIGNTTFSDLLSSSDDLQGILDLIERKYVLGYQKTAKFVEAIQRYLVLLVTTLAHSVVRELHMKPVSTIQEALDLALSIKGRGAKVLVMPKGSALVPWVEVNE
jgi:nickel-dependent lactate racemase